MIVKSLNNNFNFSAKNADKIPYAQDTLLKNNFQTRARINLDRISNAFTLYPAKGLTGNRNTNFYEILTMGIVPYLAGSAMLMAVFNSANKHFSAFAKSKASALGGKMALGVLFYGILKNVTKSFVTTPVKWITGIDTEVPYAKVNYELPDNVYDTDITSIEYHRAFESKEFPRWDLFYKSEAKGEARNEYFDKVAKKLGLGENLKDSDQETKPLIKQIAVKTDMAKTLSSYMWAALGVAYAFQKPWEEYFNVATLKFWKGEKFLHSLKVLKNSALKSAKELFKGQEGSVGIAKHAGKVMAGAAVLSSVLGVMNSVSIKKQLASTNYVDKNRKYVVS